MSKNAVRAAPKDLSFLTQSLTRLEIKEYEEQEQNELS
jgi:hypothetical protein